jgi:hypothetical protein
MKRKNHQYSLLRLLFDYFLSMAVIMSIIALLSICGLMFVRLAFSLGSSMIDGFY